MQSTGIFSQTQNPNENPNKNLFSQSSRVYETKCCKGFHLGFHFGSWVFILFSIKQLHGLVLFRIWRCCPLWMNWGKLHFIHNVPLIDSCIAQLQSHWTLSWTVQWIEKMIGCVFIDLASCIHSSPKAFFNKLNLSEHSFIVFCYALITFFIPMVQWGLPSLVKLRSCPL